jgi:4-aminobutyrate aminotransferase-like enzyme
VTTTESIIIDGYDLLAENDRLAFPDTVVCGNSLNRGTAEVSPEGTPHDQAAELKSEHARQIFPNTIDPGCPVVDLSYPTAGMFVGSPAGTYLDLYQGVAQKLVDEHHPRLTGTVTKLVETGLILRREINTDDFLAMSQAVDGLHTSQELAALINGLTQKSLPGMGTVRTFFSNSGAEAGEAAIKLAQLHTYRRFLKVHGEQVFARLMEDLSIPRVTFFDEDLGGPGDPLYADYPFFLVSCERAFHGRTMGVLNLTYSKKPQHLTSSKLRWAKHIPFNGAVSDLTDLIDARPITEILDSPGGVQGVIDSGKMPADLVALFAVECYQGEGGYHLANREWLAGIREVCTEHHILFGSDEVQSFCRTGFVYAAEHFGVQPDILWASKGAIVGMTVARAEFADDCHIGWHSNTFGGGKTFDVNMAYATIDTVVNHGDPLFEGRGYLENSRLKGEYVRMRLADLSARHPELFPDFSGLGGMWGLSVRHREEIIDIGWHMGAKLLGCGPKGDISRLRIVLLTDVLTREIDHMISVLDRTFSEVEAKHMDIEEPDPPGGLDHSEAG